MNEKYLELIKKDSVYAIIPARSGSKGVKDKNIRCVKGYPLIAFAAAASKLSGEVSRVLISTDSPYYARIGEYYGAEAPFLRPEEISRDNSTDIEFMQHAIKWLADNEGVLPEYFMHMRPTYPLRNPEIVKNAAIRMKSDDTATSLRSAYLASNTPYKWFNMGDDGYFKSIKPGLTLDEANNPRQAFPDVYIPDGYVDMLRTEFIIKNDLLHGDRMIGYVVPDGIDVDAKQDMTMLEYFVTDHENNVLDYLMDNYKPLSEAGIQE